jgi:hypothetical protein
MPPADPGTGTPSPSSPLPRVSPFALYATLLAAALVTFVLLAKN